MRVSNYHRGGKARGEFAEFTGFHVSFLGLIWWQEVGSVQGRFAKDERTQVSVGWITCGSMPRVRSQTTERRWRYSSKMVEATHQIATSLEG